MEDHNATKVSLGIHTIAGIVAGYISMFLDTALYNLGVAILILIITGYSTEFLLKKKGVKWWLLNGGVLFIVVWLVTWIFIFNLPA